MKLRDLISEGFISEQTERERLLTLHRHFSDLALHHHDKNHEAQQMAAWHSSQGNHDLARSHSLAAPHHAGLHKHYKDMAEHYRKAAIKEPFNTPSKGTQQ